ncbi:MAG: cytochrome P450 [Paracoccaceae bacterium]
MTLHPHTANTTDDPYPYYAALRAQGPLIRDEESGLVVATTLQAVRAVLGAREAQTRPASAPVPPTIADTPAGYIFGKLVRMTDGAVQQQAKAAVIAALKTVSAADLGRQAARESAAILSTRRIAPTALGFEVPVRVMAGALGFSGQDRGHARDLIADFVNCISPLSTPMQIGAATHAAGYLESRVTGLIEKGAPGLAALLDAAMSGQAGDNRLLSVANAIGLMSQTYDATGALVSLSLVALARHPGAHAMFAADPIALMREVARHDAPIQNTRRFFHAPASVLGTEIAQDQAVLLLLASANRDPAGNADADIFDPARAAPVSMTFSEGAHHCPGQEIALHLAAGVVAALLEAGFDPATIPLDALRYLPSANARIALVG